MALKISYPDWMQAAGVVVTPDAETPDLPGVSVTRSRTDEMWRTLFSGDTTAAGMSVDLGQVRDVQFIGIQFKRSNSAEDVDEVTYFDDTDTIGIKGSATTPDDDDVLDVAPAASGCLAGFGTFFLWLDEPVNLRYLRFDFNAVSQAANLCLDVVRIYVGPLFSPEINMDWNPNLTWADGGSSYARGTRSTTRYIAENDKYRVLSFQLSWIKDETERSWWRDFERRVSTTREFAISDTLEPAGTGDMFAYQSTLNGINSARVGVSTKTLRVEENI